MMLQLVECVLFVLKLCFSFLLSHCYFSSWSDMISSIVESCSGIFHFLHLAQRQRRSKRIWDVSFSAVPFLSRKFVFNYVFRFENNEMCCLYFGFATKNTDLTDMRGLYLFCALSVSYFYSKEAKNFLNSNVSEV